MREALGLFFFLPNIFFHRFFREIFGGPGVVAEAVFADSAGRDDDAGFAAVFEVGVAQIEGGGLQAVEQEASGFVVELAAEDEAHDLHERDLDGVGVLEHGEFDDGGEAERAGAVEVNMSGAPAIMEVAEAAAAKRGRAALRTVGLDVLTARNMIAKLGKTHDESSTPTLSDLRESESWQGNCAKSLDIKGLQAKSLE